jgi:hypothetical protein
MVGFLEVKTDGRIARALRMKYSFGTNAQMYK